MARTKKIQEKPIPASINKDDYVSVIDGALAVNRSLSTINALLYSKPPKVRSIKISNERYIHKNDLAKACGLESYPDVEPVVLPSSVVKPLKIYAELSGRGVDDIIQESVSGYLDKMKSIISSIKK